MTKVTTLAALVLAASVFACPQLASASGIGGMARGLKSSPAIQYILGRGPTLAPFAHVVFCMRLPGECGKGSGPAVAKVDAKWMAILQSTNDTVNHSIHPKNDAPTNVSGFDDDWELDGSINLGF